MVPLWQTDSWPPAQRSEAPREQQSSSAGRCGTPARTQGHNKYEYIRKMLVIYLLIKLSTAGKKKVNERKQKAKIQRYLSVKRLSQEGEKKLTQSET